MGAGTGRLPRRDVFHPGLSFRLYEGRIGRYLGRKQYRDNIEILMARYFGHALDHNHMGEPLNLVPQSGELSFILSNVRSLLSKVEELEIVLRSSFINMAFITETWLSENIHDSAVAFDGYSLC